MTPHLPIDQALVLEQLPADGRAVHQNDIVEASKLSWPMASLALFQLTADGYVRGLGHGLWARRAREETA